MEYQQPMDAILDFLLSRHFLSDLFIAIVIAIAPYVFKRIVAAVRYFSLAITDFIARRRSIWAKTRALHILNIYQHDIKLRTDMSEQVAWIGGWIILLIGFLSSAIFFIIIAPENKFTGILLLAIAWWMISLILSKIDRLRDPDGTDTVIKQRLIKLIDQFGLDDEICRRWLDIFHEPLP
jgi:hypothetical protein